MADRRAARSGTASPDRAPAHTNAIALLAGRTDTHARHAGCIGVAPVGDELEPTCKMEREQLLGLLDTVSVCERQRVTSEMPTATLHDLLGPELVSLPSPWFHRRGVVVMISFVATLLVGVATGGFLL